jgi:hypothetical protein
MNQTPSRITRTGGTPISASTAQRSTISCPFGTQPCVHMQPGSQRVAGIEKHFIHLLSQGFKPNMYLRLGATGAHCPARDPNMHEEFCHPNNNYWSSPHWALSGTCIYFGYHRRVTCEVEVRSSLLNKASQKVSIRMKPKSPRNREGRKKGHELGHEHEHKQV